jgi:hypothetical protein
MPENLRLHGPSLDLQRLNGRTSPLSVSSSSLKPVDSDIGFAFLHGPTGVSVRD